ncbi:protein KIC5 [Plasmodium yoelii yoelii]|uniref:Protein KIC5 n=2 Tax=Plasmodium yoelii TaxID=5861 RepID=A0AAE9WNW5_PLAYO|nr:protein KIC5 [Plasmodium yoelii yoelii]
MTLEALEKGNLGLFEKLVEASTQINQSIHTFEDFEKNPKERKMGYSKTNEMRNISTETRNLKKKKNGTREKLYKGIDDYDKRYLNRSRSGSKNRRKENEYRKKKKEKKRKKKNYQSDDNSNKEVNINDNHFLKSDSQDSLNKYIKNLNGTNGINEYDNIDDYLMEFNEKDKKKKKKKKNYSKSKKSDSNNNDGEDFLNNNDLNSFNSFDDSNNENKNKSNKLEKTSSKNSIVIVTHIYDIINMSLDLKSVSIYLTLKSADKKINIRKKSKSSNVENCSINLSEFFEYNVPHCKQLFLIIDIIDNSTNKAYYKCLINLNKDVLKKTKYIVPAAYLLTKITENFNPENELKNNKTVCIEATDLASSINNPKDNMNQKEPNDIKFIGPTINIYPPQNNNLNNDNLFNNSNNNLSFNNNFPNFANFNFNNKHINNNMNNFNFASRNYLNRNMSKFNFNNPKYRKNHFSNFAFPPNFDVRHGGNMFMSEPNFVTPTLNPNFIQPNMPNSNFINPKNMIPNIKHNIPMTSDFVKPNFSNPNMNTLNFGYPNFSYSNGPEKNMNNVHNSFNISNECNDVKNINNNKNDNDKVSDNCNTISKIVNIDNIENIRNKIMKETDENKNKADNNKEENEQNDQIFSTNNAYVIMNVFFKTKDFDHEAELMKYNNLNLYKQLYKLSNKEKIFYESRNVENEKKIEQLDKAVMLLEIYNESYVDANDKLKNIIESNKEIIDVIEKIIKKKNSKIEKLEKENERIHEAEKIIQDNKKKNNYLSEKIYKLNNLFNDNKLKLKDSNQINNNLNTKVSSLLCQLQNAQLKNEKLLFYLSFLLKHMHKKNLTNVENYLNIMKLKKMNWDIENTAVDYYDTFMEDVTNDYNFIKNNSNINNMTIENYIENQNGGNTKHKLLGEILQFCNNEEKKKISNIKNDIHNKNENQICISNNICSNSSDENAALECYSNNEQIALSIENNKLKKKNLLQSEDDEFLMDECLMTEYKKFVSTTNLNKTEEKRGKNKKGIYNNINISTSSYDNDEYQFNCITNDVVNTSEKNRKKGGKKKKDYNSSNEELEKAINNKSLNKINKSKLENNNEYSDDYEFNMIKNETTSDSNNTFSYIKHANEKKDKDKSKKNKKNEKYKDKYLKEKDGIIFEKTRDCTFKGINNDDINMNIHFDHDKKNIHMHNEKRMDFFEENHISENIQDEEETNLKKKKKKSSNKYKKNEYNNEEDNTDKKKNKIINNVYETQGTKGVITKYKDKKNMHSDSYLDNDDKNKRNKKNKESFFSIKEVDFEEYSNDIKEEQNTDLIIKEQKNISKSKNTYNIGVKKTSDEHLNDFNDFEKKFNYFVKVSSNIKKDILSTDNDGDKINYLVNLNKKGYFRTMTKIINKCNENEPENISYPNNFYKTQLKSNFITEEELNNHKEYLKAFYIKNTKGLIFQNSIIKVYVKLYCHNNNSTENNEISNTNNENLISTNNIIKLNDKKKDNIYMNIYIKSILYNIIYVNADLNGNNMDNIKIIRKNLKKKPNEALEENDYINLKKNEVCLLYTLGFKKKILNSLPLVLNVKCLNNDNTSIKLKISLPLPHMFMLKPNSECLNMFINNHSEKNKCHYKSYCYHMVNLETFNRFINTIKLYKSFNIFHFDSYNVLHSAYPIDENKMALLLIFSEFSHRNHNIPNDFAKLHFISISNSLIQFAVNLFNQIL